MDEKTQTLHKQPDDFWRELGEKVRAELKRRGYDVETMSDAEFEDLKDRLAKAVKL